MNGFLGLGGSFTADLNLLVQLAMGIALLAGWRLARRKNFRAHGICQATVMALNLVMIFLVMKPAYSAQVAPVIGKSLHERAFAVATVHAGLGGLAEVLGIYIVLVAGTKLVPARLRFQNWKRWMRAELALWWVVVLLGAGTYACWYIVPGISAAAPAAASPERVTIHVTNFDFTPKEVTVKPGTTVEWVDERGRHTIEADDGSFKSEAITAGGKFEHAFDKEGSYAYHCGFHGAMGGKDMAGIVRVVR